MDKKRLIYTIFVCSIFIIVIFYVYMQYFYLKSNTNLSVSHYFYEKNEVVNKQNTNNKSEISVQKIKYFVDNLSKEKVFKNPFISKNDIILKKYLQEIELPKLIAIIKTGNKICAILDDKIYHVGEKIGDYKIIKIKENYVILKNKNRYFKLVYK